MKKKYIEVAKIWSIIKYFESNHIHNIPVYYSVLLLISVPNLQIKLYCKCIWTRVNIVYTGFGTVHSFRSLLYFLNVAIKILHLNYPDMAEMGLLVLLESCPTVLSIGNCVLLLLFLVLRYNILSMPCVC